ncbi:MAG: hypothetical protein HGA81_05745 [Chlorobium limicola]|nr:hypothetical protein [Chlorobium limicola]
MKKKLLLAVVLVLLAPSAPAAAELRFGGEVGVRLRGEFTDSDFNGLNDDEDDLSFQYRIGLHAAADLGSGYFFKALIQNESGMSGGWQTIGDNNSESYELDVSNFIFGRALENSMYALGRLPLGSVENPIYDVLLYPALPSDIPVATFNLDRFFGGNYKTKIGPGTFSTTLVVVDNNSQDDSGNEGDGLFNDGYAFLAAYKTHIGKVVVEPEFVTLLTNCSMAYQNGMVFKPSVSPMAFGANLSVPLDEATIGLSAFCTMADDTVPNTGENVDYSGYFLRIKAEKGPFTAWFDYSAMTDRSASVDIDYTNAFLWAQYRIPVFESATGRFNLTPTVRYLASSREEGSLDIDNSRLRLELYSTMTF